MRYYEINLLWKSASVQLTNAQQHSIHVSQSAHQNYISIFYNQLPYNQFNPN